MTAPRIAWHPDGSAADVTFPYDVFVVAEIKRAVPASLRSYDPNTKTWTVAGLYVSAVYRVLAQVFGDVENVDHTATGPTFDRGTGTRNDPFVVLHLQHTAPPELIDAADRCLAKLHHPDRGGDHDTMVALTAARDAIGGGR